MGKKKKTTSITEKFVATIAILLTRKSGAYQRLLTVKHFLWSMRKQNASMLKTRRQQGFMGWKDLLQLMMMAKDEITVEGSADLLMRRLQHNQYSSYRLVMKLSNISKTTATNQCKRVPDLRRPGSVRIKRYYAKNGRLIPTAKRGKEIKQR